MLTAVRNYFSPPPPRAHEPSNREVLIFILKELRIMATNTTALVAAVAKLGSDVDALVAAHTDPASQAAVDAVTASVAAISAKAEAALAPVTPAPAAPAA